MYDMNATVIKSILRTRLSHFHTFLHFTSFRQHCCIQSNFIEITLQHGCSLVNLLHIFRAPFSKNNSDGLLLKFLSIFYLQICYFDLLHTSKIFYSQTTVSLFTLNICHSFSIQMLMTLLQYTTLFPYFSILHDGTLFFSSFFLYLYILSIKI